MLHGLDLRIYFLWRAENKKVLILLTWRRQMCSDFLQLVNLDDFLDISLLSLAFNHIFTRYSLDFFSFLLMDKGRTIN